jgi:nucleotide-binding universal stress UspA family protein
MTERETPRIQQILVATDFSEQADAALRVASTYARALGARIHLLHVISRDEADVTGLLADAKAALGPDVPVSIASMGGDPAMEIVRHAASLGVDLIVLGTHGRTGVSRVLLGSVADRVMRAAPCPVLVVPPSTMLPADERALAGPASAAPRPCVVCGVASTELICEPCRARIRGEALDHKYREERAGRP